MRYLNTLWTYATDAAGYASKAAYSAASYAKSYFIDSKVESGIEAIGDKASQLVADKLQQALYGDKERYGKVRGTDQIVDIYYRNSPVLNNLMRSATGYSIDDFINNLPFGAKQLAGPLRTYLERTIANMLIDQISNLSVKRATTAALMAANNYTQAQIEDYIEKTFANETADSNLTDLLDSKDIRRNSGSVPNLDVELEDQLGLSEVLNYYKAELQLKLDGYLKEALVEGIAEAASIVSEQAVTSGIKKVKRASLGVAAASAPIGSLPLAAIALGAGLALDEVKETAQAYAAGSSRKRAKQAAQRYLPTHVIPVDTAALGKISYEEVQFEAKEGAMSFELMHVERATLSRWAEKQAQVIATPLTQAINHLRERIKGRDQYKTSQIPEVMKNWLRDNDFSKLNSLRNGYVAIEKKLWNLSLDMMMLNEFAAGIRDDLTIDDETTYYSDDNRLAGIQAGEQQFKALEQQAQVLLAEAEMLKRRHTHVENKQRRLDLVEPAMKRINQLVGFVQEDVKDAQVTFEEAYAEEALKEEKQAAKTKKPTMSLSRSATAA